MYRCCDVYRTDRYYISLLDGNNSVKIIKTTYEYKELKIIHNGPWIDDFIKILDNLVIEKEAQDKQFKLHQIELERKQNEIEQSILSNYKSKSENK